MLDPFCGGGSIPLEAQRLGLRADASDLNPIPVLITKALIEIPPRFAGWPPINPGWKKEPEASKAVTIWAGAQGLAEDVRFYGKWMRDQAEERIGHLYPKVKITKEMAKDRPDLEKHVGQELTVVAWLWARTVASPNPAVKGAHTPLVRSFWLSTKKGKEVWVRPIIDRKANAFQFVAGSGKPPSDFDPGKGTVDRKGGRCILTNEPMPFSHIRAEGQAGRMRSRLMAIVADGPGGRVYLSPQPEQVRVAESASPAWKPEAQLPDNPRDFKTPNYGICTFADLFTARQLVALTTFSDLIREVREQALKDVSANSRSCEVNAQTGIASEANAYVDALITYLALAISKVADWCSTLCGFIPSYGKFGHTFGRQALPMVWDYAELNVFSDAVGNWSNHVEWVSRAIEHVPCGVIGTVANLDARTGILSQGHSRVICTDPPYYDNIGYADLSDFFYVWLRRSLGHTYPSLFATLLTPKSQELIASPYRHSGSKQAAQGFFEEGLGMAFALMQQAQVPEYPLTIYYAFKQSESDEGAPDVEPDAVIVPVSTGWETMLSGLIRAGFSIHGTWPMRTERGARSIGIGKNALASSIILVCRSRTANASLATRKEFMSALRRELPVALKNLQHGNIAPVDLAQAAIGPGMAVFTRYSKVIESDGTSMTVRAALGIINQVLDEVLAEQEGEFDADTRWALAWFDQFGTAEGSFGVAETLSKAKNTAVRGLVEAKIVKARGGKVQLISRADLPDGWDPTTDKRLTVWETTQHLIRRLETAGEAGAADLLNKLGGVAEAARDLAYRLYSICERKKWADEALAYNGLVIAWPELTKLALSERTGQPSTQQDLFS